MTILITSFDDTLDNFKSKDFHNHKTKYKWPFDLPLLTTHKEQL